MAYMFWKQSKQINTDKVEAGTAVADPKNEVLKKVQKSAISRVMTL